MATPIRQRQRSSNGHGDRSSVTSASARGTNSRALAAFCGFHSSLNKELPSAVCLALFASKATNRHVRMGHASHALGDGILKAVLRFRCQRVGRSKRWHQDFRARYRLQLRIIPGVFRKLQRAVLRVADAPVRKASAFGCDNPAAASPYEFPAAPSPMAIDPQCAVARLRRHDFGKRRGRWIGDGAVVRTRLARGQRRWQRTGACAGQQQAQAGKADPGVGQGCSSAA